MRRVTLARVSFDAAERAGNAVTANGHLVVVQATRADELVADLAERLRAVEFGDPLDECIVVLQGAGMHRWIRREMAHRLGAWGGVETPFLRKFLFDITSRAANAPVATSSRQDIQELAYRIAAHVTRVVAEGGEVDRIAPFLAACRDASGALEMQTLLTHCHTLAESFDRYEMDRPEMIASWEGGDVAWRDPSKEWSQAATTAESWQRALWREVVPGKWKSHDAWKQLRALIKSLESGACPPSLREIRFVSVFGVSTLPPLVFAFLDALARHIPVHVHMLVATEAFIDSGGSDRKIAALAARAGTDIATFRAQNKRDERSNLLQTLGVAAFETAKVIDGLARADEILREIDVPDPTTLLGALQQGLRADVPARDVQVGNAAEVDASLQFHAVSSAARAAEVVHDEVLRACADFPGLLQEEIAILVPSLESYGAAIESVFERRAADMPADSALSLHTADAAAADQSPLAAAVMAMMTLVIEDAAFVQMRALISHAVVCHAMGHEVDEVRKQLDLLADAGATRFFDAAHRVRWLGKSDAADDQLHTLAWATNRVILATVAIDSPAKDHAIDSCLASDQARGFSIPVFHAIGARIDALQAFAETATQTRRPIDEWAAQLATLCDLFLPKATDSQWGEQRVKIAAALATIAKLAKDAALPPVEFAVARGEFARELEKIVDGQRFASGGVTLARLAPMRSVPFRFIALVGVDRGVFPRPFKSNLMDIETLCPRAGDRNARNDDLLLLLESIHAATDRLVIVYEGIEPSTSRAKPPSPVVDQLIETCAGHLELSAAAATAKLCRTHTPMGDQPEAWQLGVPAGFDAKARERAQTIAAARTEVRQRSFVDAAAPVTNAPVSTRVEIPSIEEMARVLRDPVSAYMKASGVQPADTSELIGSASEPIEFDPQHDGLHLFKLRQQSLPQFMQGRDASAIREELRLQGALPHGASGTVEWEKLVEWSSGGRAAVEALFESRGLSLGAGWTCDLFTFDVTGSSPAIVCETLRIESAATQLLIMRAKKPADKLPLWLQHLSWCATHPNAQSILIELPIEKGGGAKWLDPVDAQRAAKTINEVGSWTAAALTELMPFHGNLLKEWFGGRDQRKTQTPERQIERAADELLDVIKFNKTIPLAFRGQEFFEYASLPASGGKPQTFVDIATWLAGLLDETGWSV